MEKELFDARIELDVMRAELSLAQMQLVEIVRGLETGAESLRLTEEVARRMGKETVVVRESPGFITSRINAMIGNEAFFMLEEGVASARAAFSCSIV